MVSVRQPSNAFDVPMVDDHQRSGWVLDLVAQDLAHVLRVDGDLDGPDQRQTEPHVDELDRVVEHDKHGVPGPDALGGEYARAPPSPRPEVGIRISGGAKVDGDLARPGLHGRLEDPTDRAPSAHSGRHSRIV